MVISIGWAGDLGSEGKTWEAKGNWEAKGEKRAENARRPHWGCGLLENGLNFIGSAWSSDTARAIIVERATTEGCAEMGPGECHGAGEYIRMALRVKRDR